ncbi:hypothetical protein [Saezia sanguinis]|nr:hypothetical protein [Saezia sanguinis]
MPEDIKKLKEVFSPLVSRDLKIKEGIPAWWVFLSFHDEKG